LNLGHRIEPLLRADQHPASDERHVGVPCEVGSGANDGVWGPPAIIVTKGDKWSGGRLHPNIPRRGAKVPVELYQPNGIVLAAQLSEAALIRCVVDHDDLEDAS